MSAMHFNGVDGLIMTWTGVHVTCFVYACACVHSCAVHCAARSRENKRGRGQPLCTHVTRMLKNVFCVQIPVWARVRRQEFRHWLLPEREEGSLSVCLFVSPDLSVWPHLLCSFIFSARSFPVNYSIWFKGSLFTWKINFNKVGPAKMADYVR